MIINPNKRLLLILTLAVIGFLLNYYRSPFLLGSEFIFGPFCSLVIARYLGIKIAALFSTLVSIPLISVWSPFIVIIYTLEACFVAFIISKGRRNILSANVMFWLLIGLPIAWILTSRNPDINPTFQYVYLAKLLLNAILYSLLASVVINFQFIKYCLSKNKEPVFITLRQRTANHISVIFSLLMSAVLLSYFYYQVINLDKSTKNNMALVHAKIHSEFNHKMTTFTQVFTEKKHLFAEIWHKPERVDKQLHDLHLRYPEFISMMIADIKGDIQSFSLQGNNKGINLINIKDRPYFVQAINQQGVYVSSGFEGKGFGNDHIIAISTAVIDADNDQVLGILEGSLKLSSIQELSASWGAHKPFLTLITDQNQQTIKANTSNFTGSLKPINFKKSPYELFSRPLFKINGLNSLYMTDQSTFDWGWQLTTMIDQIEIADLIQEIMIFLMLVLLSSIFISQWLAWFLSKLWTNQLTKVSEWVGSSKTDLPDAEEIPHLANEIKVLYEDIKHSRKQYIKLNKELESKVVAQTSQLFEANQKLEKLSFTDSLTSLENRRAFDKKLQTAWDKESSTKITFHLIDIDHFKKINDLYGHPIGDLVLIFLSQCFKKLKTDSTLCIARIGGEEFAIVSENISKNDAAQIAQNIFDILKNQNHLFEGKTIKLSVSIGIAAADTNLKSIKSLYRNADKALYQAKQAGRSQFNFSK